MKMLNNKDLSNYRRQKAIIKASQVCRTMFINMIFAQMYSKQLERYQFLHIIAMCIREIAVVKLTNQLISKFILIDYTDENCRLNDNMLQWAKELLIENNHNTVELDFFMLRNCEDVIKKIDSCNISSAQNIVTFLDKELTYI